MIDRDLGRYVLRTARRSDLESYMALARATGGGFTTLPADEAVLGPRLKKNEAAFDTLVQRPNGEDYVFVLEDRAAVSGADVIGTSAIYSKLGSSWPFYSFRVSELNRHSPGLAKVVRNKILVLTSDFDDCTEVGGLFLLSDHRRSLAGRLLSLGRFIFMADHPSRVSSRIVAELRGIIDEDNQSPFWNAVGRHFFDLDFQDADRFGAINGNQFIADLMPSHPIYVNMLPIDAQNVIGLPHSEGGGALRLLLNEGFIDDGYVDIFDGGPTVHCLTQDVRSVRDSKILRFDEASTPAANVTPFRAMIATGTDAAFRCTIGEVHLNRDETVRIDGASVDALALKSGDTVRLLTV